MCEQSTLVPIPVWALDRFVLDSEEFGIDSEGRRCFRIDSCIEPALRAVWAAGFKTLGCCCGHGQGSGVISLDLFREGEGLPQPHHCPKCGQEHTTFAPETLTPPGDATA